MPPETAEASGAAAASRAGAPTVNTLQDLLDWLATLGTTEALLEFSVFMLCLGTAFVVVRVLRGPRVVARSVWFGSRVFDGVLFPAMALGLALLARWLLQNTLPLTVFQFAVPVLWALLIIRLGVRVLQVAFPQSQLVRVFERSLSWVVWAGLVLWLTGLLPLLLHEMNSIQWTLGGISVSLRSIVEGALSALAVMLLMLWLSAAIEARLMAGALETGSSANLSVRKIAANAIRALLLLIGLLLAMSAAGIPLGALSVVGGAVGLGIGFGLQKLAANYVSGFVILAERSLRIGDMVKVDSFEGRITDINTRYTVVRALNGRESIVPNEMMMTQRIENLSLSDPRVVLSTTVNVAYGTDMDMLMPRLRDAVAGVPRVLADPGPAVQLANFGADGLELIVSFWIGDPHNGQGGVKSDVNLALLRTLNAHGVAIPYPQRVVHQMGSAD
jgi:small-conductance mechanosensitive channel